MSRPRRAPPARLGAVLLDPGHSEAREMSEAGFDLQAAPAFLDPLLRAFARPPA